MSTGDEQVPFSGSIPTVELEALKNSRGFIPGYSYRHIPKKLSLISLYNDDSLNKTHSATVRKKCIIYLH